jgi:hypothetical protein
MDHLRAEPEEQRPRDERLPVGIAMRQVLRDDEPDARVGKGDLSVAVGDLVERVD